ncbi:hypothetical protein KIH86_17785 [Paenibacillus sp. HN-1]|uniref:hypothetical protein n=1 Tax=Paenibacillus TaxID=44249 RepID=UPI001CA95D8E|nr:MULTISPECIES: hypothetical protein [Paenibacillus]MBY9078279.1 hypothetical protein [Paenibacillus sp. CGMCC 1.18879]MBY9086062.1 hypothetical protein [Paenibacillus sinensis]
MQQTDLIAAELIERLKREGFIVQRYDSVTTSSVYLKLDYGVANSIRIGDHRGKKQYKYRYNIDIGRKQINRHTTGEGWPRWYYPETELDSLFRDLLRERERIKQRFGPDQYWALMAQKQFENRGNKGFWRSAKLV